MLPDNGVCGDSEEADGHLSSEGRSPTLVEAGGAHHRPYPLDLGGLPEALPGQVFPGGSEGEDRGGVPRLGAGEHERQGIRGTVLLPIPVCERVGCQVLGTKVLTGT